jgi:hypothetical protein
MIPSAPSHHRRDTGAKRQDSIIKEKMLQIKPICIKAVTPAKAGVQKSFFFLDSGFRRNDRKAYFLSFCDPIFFDLQRRYFLLRS